MRFGNFLFPQSENPEQDGQVIDDTLAEAQLCDQLGMDAVWFHRSFGPGSVSPAAERAGREAGLTCIAGGCPLMYVDPVDVGHRCMRWWLSRRGRVPT